MQGATRPASTRKTLLQPCLIWQGAKDNTGYGVMRCAQGTMGLPAGIVRVHRLMYFYTKGAFPRHMQIDHLCRNRLCVEPTHLKMVGPSEHGRISHQDREDENHDVPL